MVNSLKLLEILEKEAKVLQEAVELEDRFYTVLVERDGKALAELNGEKGQLAAAMEALEEERRAAMPAGLTLKEYLSGEDPPGAAELERLRQSILALHGTLQHKQKITRRLLLFNRRLVRQALQLLAPDAGESLYCAAGEKIQGQFLRAGLLDSNA